MARNWLRCTREDGSNTSVSLGPDIPYHDIAHYVVEKKFGLNDGFFGKIRSGMCIEELSDPEIIKTLGPESWLAEIMARNLQALGSKAVQPEQYLELTQWEAQNMKGVEVPDMTTKDIEAISTEYNRLCSDWDVLLENESLQLDFE